MDKIGRPVKFEFWIKSKGAKQHTRIPYLIDRVPCQAKRWKLPMSPNGIYTYIGVSKYNEMQARPKWVSVSSFVRTKLISSTHTHIYVQESFSYAKSKYGIWHI